MCFGQDSTFDVFIISGPAPLDNQQDPPVLHVQQPIFPTGYLQGALSSKVFSYIFFYLLPSKVINHFAFSLPLSIITILVNQIGGLLVLIL